LGIVLVLLFSAFIIAALLAVREAILLMGHQWKRKWRLDFFTNVIVSIGAVLVCVCLVELGLLLHQWFYTPGAGETAAKTLTIPGEWEKKPVKIKNTRSAYYWHGVLHVHDKHWMRRTQPFPAKQDHVFRIMVVGDSLTYGMGVKEEDTYSRVLERLLGKEYYCEVLNLGVCGMQSSDILETVRTFAPLLKPDLIVYGISLNDFLPSGTSQYRDNRRWPFPLPEAFKHRMSRQTYIGAFLERAYDKLLMRIGVRRDFYDDILENFQDFQVRFAEDLRKMNAFVIENGFSPILAVVFHQHPEYRGRSYRIAQIAETAARNAGMNVVPIEEFFKTYDGQFLGVSQWEGHPNAKAHRILAQMLLPVIQKIPGLKKLKRPGRVGDRKKTGTEK
jgi:lysophospholipase L1-like esterase